MRCAMTVIALLVSGATGLLAQEGPYKFAREIPIGGEGGWDYLSVDSAAHRLYVSHATKVVVIDTQANKMAGEIADTPGVHGFAIASELMIDNTNGKVVYSVPIGDGPDSSWFDPGTKLAFSSNGGPGTVTVAREESPGVLKVIQTLKTTRGARTMALDPATHTIYLAAADYEPQAPGSKERPKAIAGTFKVLVYQMTGSTGSTTK